MFPGYSQVTGNTTNSNVVLFPVKKCFPGLTLHSDSFRFRWFFCAFVREQQNLKKTEISDSFRFRLIQIFFLFVRGHPNSMKLRHQALHKGTFPLLCFIRASSLYIVRVLVWFLYFIMIPDCHCYYELCVYVYIYV